MANVQQDDRPPTSPPIAPPRQPTSYPAFSSPALEPVPIHSTLTRILVVPVLPFVALWLAAKAVGRWIDRAATAIGRWIDRELATSVENRNSRNAPLRGS